MILNAQVSNERFNRGDRSAIVDAHGFVYLAEDKTISELREEAKANAKRNALEKGETYIRSLTRIENFQLQYDLIFSESEGYIKMIEEEDCGITEDNRYQYWIKAELKYDLSLFHKDAPLTVKIWTDRNQYQLNDEILIFIKGNKNFFAKIIYEDAAGNLIQLLPNQFRSENYFQAEMEYQIPGKNENFNFKVEAPFGDEIIRVYVSTSFLGNGLVEPLSNSFFRITEELDQYSKKTRGVRIVESDAGASEFYETEYKISTIGEER